MAPDEHSTEPDELRSRIDSMRARRLAILILVLFLGWFSYLITILDYGFDEGVYTFQALAIRQGLVPARDFFVHQPPLYPLILSVLTNAESVSLPLVRLPSMFAVLLAGWLVFLIGSRHFSPRTGLIGLTLFLGHPLHRHSLLAYPNALMMLCAALAFWLVARNRSPRSVVAAAVCLAAATLFKPTAMASAAAIAAALVVCGQRRLLGWLAGGFAGASAAALALSEWAAEGGISSVLRLQVERLQSHSGFELMSRYESFAYGLSTLEIGSLLEWNAKQIAESALAISSGALLTSLLAMVGCCALPALFRQRESRFTAALVSVWCLIPLSAFLFVWDPTWNHYLVEILAPVSLLAGLAIDRYVLNSRRLALQLSGIAVPLALTILGTTSIRQWRLPPELQDLDRHAGRAVLAFDPSFNLLTATTPACGLIDPFNVFGDRALISASSDERVSRFWVGGDDVARCLAEDESILFAPYRFHSWFLDEPLSQWVGSLPEDRIFRVEGTR